MPPSAPQAIRYPTDLSLLNEAREVSEKIIDKLYLKMGPRTKPRTYRQKSRQVYLAVIKQRRHSSAETAKSSETRRLPSMDPSCDCVATSLKTIWRPCQ